MSQRVQRQIDFLKVLCKASHKQRCGIIEGTNSELIKVICECALNCLKRNVSLTHDQKQKLNRHKQKLRSLADKKCSIARKKEFLVQKGGFLSLLLKPILAAITTLAPVLLRK